jgi:tRNA pseudouridine55 synthase
LTDGLLVLDKPAGISSAGAVDRVKRVLGIKHVGHGGTLDPIATGVLAVCIGAATKLSSYLLADDKAYEAEGRFGIETDTLDRTGTVTAERPVEVTREALIAALAGRLGEQEQMPPMYSAIKQGGVRLYHRARAGEDVERAPRKIRLDQMELLSFEPPRFRIAIACSKGTYVRSILADLGTELGCGAHMTELRRTRSGTLTIEQAVTLDQLPTLDLAAHLIPLTRMTGLPIVVVEPGLVASVLHAIQLPPARLGSGDHELFQLVDESGRLLAIAHREGYIVAYDRVFPA